MIIFAKSDGTVIETKPTPFYQGSSLKGSIYLVSPFPNTNGVTIQFQLPNGNVTKAYPMTPTGEVEGVMLDGYEVSAWTWNVKNAMVTAIPGVVTATIKVIDTDDNVTSIVSSFSIIKGTPNALDVSTPSASEWEAIISALNEIGGKVTKPLMTNFTYNIATGESEKTYNNGMRQTENFPAVLPDTMTEYESFTKTVFYESSWRYSDRQGYNYMYTFELPTLSSSGDNFAIEVYSQDDFGYKKMNPIVIINMLGSAKVSIYSNEAYSGYALFFWKGSFAEQNYKEEIEKAIDDCEGATAQAENIANTLETAYENGDFIGPQGPQGEQGPQGVQGPQGEPGEGIPSGGTAGQILTKTESGTAWEDAPSGGASFSYYTAVFVDLDAYNYMASGFYLPDMTNVDKVELDSMVMEYNNGDGSNTYIYEIIASKSFVDSNYMPITVIYANGVWQQLPIHPKDQYDNFLYLQMSINASNPNSVFVFVNNYDDGYTQYYPKQMTFRIYPKEN